MKKQKKTEAQSAKTNQKKTTPAPGIAGSGNAGLPLAYHPALLQGMMQYPAANMMMGMRRYGMNGNH